MLFKRQLQIQRWSYQSGPLINNNQNLFTQPRPRPGLSVIGRGLMQPRLK